MLALYIVAVSVSYSVNKCQTLIRGNLSCFPPQMSRNVNKKFVELYYAGYLKFQHCILQQLVSFTL